MLSIENVAYIVFFSIFIFLIILVLRYIPVPQETAYVPETTKSVSPSERCLSIYNGLILHDIYPVFQYRVGYYRLDLAIPSKKIAIGTDGKAYHSSPAQKADDNKRDKYLREKGWTVIRVSGSKTDQNLLRVIAEIKKDMSKK